MMSVAHAIERQRPLPLGDLYVIGRPPAKLLKAFAIIGAHLHPLFDEDKRIVTGKSKVSCILCSLTVCDFFHKVGFPRATCEPCAALVYGFDAGSDRPYHSVGAVPDAQGPGWSGHLVVVCEGCLVDPTFYQFQRSQHWPGLPGMVAFPALGFPKRDLVADVTMPREDRRLEIGWSPQPQLRSWKTAPDAHRERRKEIVKGLVARMQGWRS